MQIVARGDNECDFVWTTDVLPHAAAAAITPLMEQGALPNLQRLVHEGAWGVLEAEPAVVNPVANSATMGMRSPVLWETMAN